MATETLYAVRSKERGIIRWLGFPTTYKNNADWYFVFANAHKFENERRAADYVDQYGGEVVPLTITYPD